MQIFKSASFEGDKIIKLSTPVEDIPVQNIEPSPRTANLDDWKHSDLIFAALHRDLVKNPDDYVAHYNRSYFNLSSGNFVDGWDELAWRLLVPGQPNYQFFPIEVWDHQDIKGKNIFVWCEQGIGDQIFAAGMFADLIKDAGSVTVFCNRRLVPLFKRSFPTITFHKPTDKVDFSKFDYQMTFGDLGALYRKSWDEFPKHKGFIKPDPEKTAQLRKKYQSIKPGNTVVGLSWFSAAPRIGPGKTLELHELNALAGHKNITYVSLQYEPNIPEWNVLKPYVDTSFDQMCDMDSFAAQVAAMDGVVSISNTALHMAGALNIPTLGLLSRGGCRNWYWFNERTDCPWYPSVELVRQDIPGDWTLPIQKANQWVS